MSGAAGKRKATAGAVSPMVVSDPAALAEAAARWTADRLVAAVEQRGVAYLALAGGDTPRRCYQRLAQPPYQTEVPWPRLRVYWSDERQVPLDDPASNYGMARAALLDHVPIPKDQIFPLVPDSLAALDTVPRDGEGRPRFDLIHLGLGEDGHTASLFFGDPVLEERQALVCAVRAAKPPPERLTFTLPVLNAARAVLFMVQGASKRQALLGVLRRDPALPASQVRPDKGQLQFIVDRASMGG